MIMKKLIYALCVALCSGMCMLSCSDDNYSEGGPEQSGKNLEMPEKYKVIGKRHNEGLAAAFSALRKYYKVETRADGEVRKLSKEECLALMEDALQKYCVSKGCDNIELLDLSLVDGAKTRSVIEMKPEVKVLVDKMMNEILNKERTPKQMVDVLNDINKEADATLSEEDAIAVYAGTSTCYYSYLYWKENHMKWIIALNNPELLGQYEDEILNSFNIHKGELVFSSSADTRGWWDDAWGAIGETWDSGSEAVSNWWNYGGGKEVVAEDGAGAVGGAVSGGIAGSTAGGIGAVPGAGYGALAGGAGASVAQALRQWLN
jgi:hypothetical protein